MADETIDPFLLQSDGDNAEDLDEAVDDGNEAEDNDQGYQVCQDALGLLQSLIAAGLLHICPQERPTPR